MAVWKVGFNFRDTAIYVTDGADEIYVLGETSSTVRATANGNSATFHWSSGLETRNRNAGGDARLAGVNFAWSNGTRVLYVTLPQAGTYIVRLAMGDNDTDFGGSVLYINDGATNKLTIEDTVILADHYNDASGVDRTRAAWPGSNVAVELTFASTDFRLQLGPAGDPGAYYRGSPIAHLYLEYVPSFIPYPFARGARGGLGSKSGGLQ